MEEECGPASSQPHIPLSISGRYKRRPASNASDEGRVNRWSVPRARRVCAAVVLMQAITASARRRRYAIPRERTTLARLLVGGL